VNWVAYLYIFPINPLIEKYSLQREKRQAIINYQVN